MNSSPHTVSPARPASQPGTDLAPARSSNIYQLLGGAATIRRLADRFYQLMDELPEARRLRRLHRGRLEGSAKRLFEHLTGWLGGPALCSARPGRPCLEAVGSIECNEWQLCMRLALAEQIEDAELRAVLLQALNGMAEALIRESIASSTQQEPQP